MEKPLPDFATALAGYYPANPSPGQDSGVMSPMTPMSNYTQGSTPEQFVTSPDHLNYLEFCDSPLSAAGNSDEGIIVSKCHSAYYEPNWSSNYTTVNYQALHWKSICHLSRFWEWQQRDIHTNFSWRITEYPTKTFGKMLLIDNEVFALKWELERGF